MERVRKRKNKSVYTQKIRRNITLFPYYNFFRIFYTESPILIIYLGLVLGSYTKAASIITLYTISLFLFEVPMGILSDKIGRKTTLTLASFFNCSKYVFFIIGNYNSQYYFIFVLATISSGISDALESGTDNALLFESVKEMKKKHKFHNASGKSFSMVQLSLGVAALVGGIVASKSYATVFYIGLLAQICALITTLFFVEPKKIEQSRDNPFKHFKEAFKLIVLNRKLRNMSLARVVCTSNASVSHMMQPAFFQLLIPIWLIGVTRMLKHIMVSSGLWFSGKIIDKFNHLKTLVFSILTHGVINIFVLLFSSVFTPFIMVFASFFYGVRQNTELSLFQDEFTDKQRATMDSIVSMFNSLAFGLICLISGYIIDIFGSKFVIILLETFTLSSAFIYYITLKNKPKA